MLGETGGEKAEKILAAPIPPDLPGVPADFFTSLHQVPPLVRK